MNDLIVNQHRDFSNQLNDFNSMMLSRMNHNAHNDPTRNASARSRNAPPASLLHSTTTINTLYQNNDAGNVQNFVPTSYAEKMRKLNLQTSDMLKL